MEIKENRLKEKHIIKVNEEGEYMARKVVIGKQDFAALRENDYFYVDKSDFIKEWWDSGDDVTLITRPHRFGKTLNMSMLNCFFPTNTQIGEICLKGFPYGKMMTIEKYREHTR